MVEISEKKITPGRFLLRLARFIIVIVVAVLLAKFLIELKKKPEKKEIVKTPPSVNIFVTHPESKVMTVEAFGTVKPRKKVKVAVEVPGRIISLHRSFIEGGIIPQGEILVRIDPQTYQLERSSAQVRIDQAKTDIENFKQEIKNLENDIELSRANLALSKKELERIKTLTQNKYASKNSQDRTEQQFIQARMQLQNLENRLNLTDTVMETKKATLAMALVDFDKADLALERTIIRSDFTGYVLEKHAEKGEYVNPGQVLGIVYQKDHLDVDVRIPIEKTKWLKGIFENYHLPKVEIRMASSNGLKHPGVWKGQVARLKANMDEQTRTLPLTIEIQAKEIDTETTYDLKPGTFVKCDIIGKMIDSIYVIPRYLLKQGNVLFTVQDSRLKKKKVSILRKFEEEVYINGGLNSGDKIISSPLPGALDGMPLTVLSDRN